MTQIHIQISNKYYAKQPEQQNEPVISDLNMMLHSGEFVCLVGPSGCGKTTLLNMLAGLDRNFHGEIRFGIQTTPPTIGYVFQNPRLLPWRTVKENLILALPPDQSEDLIDALLEAMSLTAMADTYPEHLSLGMSRRVAIIRAFCVNPDLLLMDEPFVSLDPPTARQVRTLLLQLWQQKPHTVLFVTHDLREAITLADRLIFLSKSPMRIIRQMVVDIPRNDRDQDLKIEKFRNHLIENFPEIQSLL